MTYVLSQAPLAEPITLAEFKTHLKIDHSDEDALLESLIKAARQYLEYRAGLAVMSQVWRLVLDDWPKDGFLTLQKTPVQSVDQIVIYDEDGVSQNLDLSATILDSFSKPARLYVGAMARPGQLINGIEIVFTAGYSSASEVPDTLKRALLLHASHLYEFRGVVALDMQPASVPQGYEALISPFVRKSL